MKATQSQIKEAVDSFFYTYEWLTGGTLEETERQAFHGILALKERAAKVAELAANPNKVASNNKWLMERALVRIPEKIAFYQRYIQGTPEHAERTSARSEQQKQNAAQCERELKIWNALESLVAESTPDNVIFHDFRAA
jgi:hypothetical protein